MSDARSITEHLCANCGAPHSAEYCGQCGQHERGSRRLQVRDIAANCAAALTDVESPLPATLTGLFRSPGRVCLDYIHGRRKRYMNPFAFLLVAVTAQIILSAVLRWTGWIVPTPDESDAIPDEALNGVLFAVVVPLAFLWTSLFAVSNRTFAENYVLGLYVLGQFAWLELALLPLTTITVADSILLIVYPTVWLIMATWAGAIFYSMNWYSVLWRMVASSAATFIIVGGLLFAALEAVACFRPGEITK